MITKNPQPPFCSSPSRACTERKFDHCVCTAQADRRFEREIDPKVFDLSPLNFVVHRQRIVTSCEL